MIKNIFRTFNFRLYIKNKLILMIFYDNSN